MIIFRCSNCNYLFNMPDKYAGQCITCTVCDHQMIIPDPNTDTVLETPDDEPLCAEDIFKPSKSASDHGTDCELNLRTIEELNPSASNSKACLSPSIFEPEPKNEMPLSFEDAVENPRWFWPFVFPFSSAGLGMIALFVLCRILFYLIQFLLISPMVLILIIFAIYYLFWYLSACIQTTAKGRVRPPVTLFEDKEDLDEKISCTLRMLLAIAISMGLATLYFFINAVSSEPEDIVNIALDMYFWYFLLLGQFFLPMMLLSVILNDSLAGLNPAIIYQSIKKTWWSYLRLVLYLSILMEFMITLFILSCIWSGTGLDLCALALSYYLCIMSAAILGRFFYRNEKILDWEV